MDLKREKALFEVSQRGEIVGRQDFPLDNREVDFDLVEPTGVVGRMDEDGIGPLGTKAVGGSLAPMSGAVVHDPEDATCRLVGLLAHDFSDEAIHRRDAILEFATTEYFGTVDIPSRQIDSSALTKVLVFNSGWAVRCGRRSRLFTTAGLNARLFVGRDHKIVSAQWSTFPDAMVQIKNRAGLGSKIGITRKDPASVLPRAKGVATEPSPQGRATNLSDEALSNHVLPNFLNG